MPEAFGGLDFGVVGAGLIAREMARKLAPSPFLSTSVLSASALARAGSRGAEGGLAAADRARRGDRRLRARRGRAPRRDRDQATRTAGLAARRRQAFRARRPCRRRAVDRRQGRGTRRRCFSPRPTRPASRATRAPSSTAGASRASLSTASLVDADARLDGRRSRRSRTSLDIGRAVVAAALCGVAEEAFARTARYLKERRQFDRRIGSFQALQHRAARVHIEIENAWSATLQGAAVASRRAPIPPRSTSRSPRPRRARRRARRRPSACRCMAASA